MRHFIPSCIDEFCLTCRLYYEKLEREREALCSALDGLVPDLERDGDRARMFLQSAVPGVAVKYYDALHIVIDAGEHGKRLKCIATV